MINRATEKVSAAINAFKDYNTLSLFPVIHTLRHYSLGKLRGDVLAGFNVALLTFPQAMAYALVAGLPIQYGIYASAVSMIVGAFFSASRFIVMAPTNATAILLMSAFSANGISDAEKLYLLPLFLILIGVFLVIGAYLKVANLIQYLSRSVVIGYVNAAVILTCSNQMRHILGIEVSNPAFTFYTILIETFQNIGQVHVSCILVSALTFFIYWTLIKRFPRLPNIGITLILMSAIGFLMDRMTVKLFFLDPINVEAWSLQLPSLSFHEVSLLANAAFAIALMCMMEASSIGKSLAARSGESIDMNQEILSLGCANIACAFASGMPTSGSLTRSVLNWSSGARTPFASLACGVLCVAGAVYIGPATAYIPRSVLAVLVILAATSLINWKQIRIVISSTKSDAIVYFTTLVCGLIFPLDTAIYIGVSTSVVLFLKKAAIPEMVEYKFDERGQLSQLGEDQQRPIPEVSIVHVEGNLFFGAAELFRQQMRRVCQEPNLKVVILRLKNAHYLDATSVMALQELNQYMRENKRWLLISGVRKEILRVIKNSTVYEELGKQSLFMDVPENPNMSTARALKRAQKLIGSMEAKISIYTKSVQDIE